MAKIEGFRIKNFKALKDIEMGILWNTPKSKKKKALTPMTAVIGKNGAGKSSIFDAFGFLADCLKYGVEEACDINERGGFKKIRSLGQETPIEFEIYYKEDSNSRPITYEVSFDNDEHDRHYVSKEILRQRRSDNKGYPFSFLFLQDGKGIAWKGEEGGIDDKKINDLYDLMQNPQKEESNERENVELNDYRKLGIATLGSLKQHPRISAFRRFIEGWYLSYFTPKAARSLPLAGPQKHLNATGDNLGNFVQFMEREHPKKFDKILERIAKKIPGIHKIKTEKTQDGRLLLCFNDKGFTDPFFSQQMSDGTLKIFAYLLLLEDPEPSPFLCIEEPENGLYHKLLDTLATEFRRHATGKKDGTQIFVTTHQPYFVNALEPQEVWILEKQPDGFSSIRRASDDDLVCALHEQGLPLGGLWFSDYLDKD